MSETQLRQQVRANRRLRILAAASVVGVIVAAEQGPFLLIGQANEADRGRAQAEAARLVAEIRGEPDLSASAVLQLAVEGRSAGLDDVDAGPAAGPLAGDPGLTARGTPRCNADRGRTDFI